MNEIGYLPTIKQLLEQVGNAKKEVLGYVPQEIIKKHWIVKKHSPDPWSDVQHWYLSTEGYRSDVVLALDAIIALSRSQECLSATILQHRPMGDLTLPKVRRPS